MDEIKSENDSTDIYGLSYEFLMRIFQVTIDWIKNETNSIDIDYFGENFFIHTKQYFDNGNFSIELKTDEYNQLGLKMPLNNFINENDGSLKDVDDFIIRVGNEIYELTRRKKLMDKERITTKTTLINQQKNHSQLDNSSSFSSNKYCLSLVKKKELKKIKLIHD
ncbi:unnamed protein product [Rotaria sp. Silwood2]|nr:unnamed protein product [Rotaria sp. Silwood2]CAF2802907.1 unnamed protein product [Rotaria sp. Silwood2]CAF3044877.1 unnamed protein product [Rotaria sp. Silwood2]CAF3211096.1 unnamed protein product [Rotaria sp. Silwood2]CAF3944525.1 unnamed protein product [Rotaria sp. Silwood2]